jgi:transposase
MEQHAGIDVSLEWSSVCIVDASGKIVRETKVASEPEVLVAFFKGLSFPVRRIGLEAGPLSQWLQAGLARAGFETVLLETRHVKAALSAMSIKTDRNDARGIAQLMRMGWFRPVHAKSIGCERCLSRASSYFRSLWILRQACAGSCGDLD